MKLDMDKFHYHEALDRSYLIGDLLTIHLSDHPVIETHKDLKKRVKKAEKLLAEVYQRIGNYSYKKFYK